MWGVENVNESKIEWNYLKKKTWFFFVCDDNEEKEKEEEGVELSVVGNRYLTTHKNVLLINKQRNINFRNFNSVM